MKRQINLIPLVALLFAGCATLQPGADPVVVRAEQTYQTAFDTTDVVFKLDEDNRAYVLQYAPEVHKQINAFKPRAKQALNNARNALHAYKYNRTPENKANLDTYLALARAIMIEAQGYQKQLPTNP